MTSKSSPRSEGEPKRRRKARRRRKNRLIAVGQRTNGTDLRIPHVVVGDVDVDLAVARGVPAVLRRPQHREVAPGDTQARTRRADAAHESWRHGVGGRDLAQPEEPGFVRARRVGFDISILLQEWVILLNDRECRALIVERANLRIRLEMPAIAVDARIESQVLIERDGRVEARLPGRLRVPPVDARRDRAVHIRSALLEPSLSSAAVAERGEDLSRWVECDRADPVQEEVGDAEADAVLRLPAAAGDCEELRTAHVLDAIPIVGELRAELPSDAPALEDTRIGRELVAPTAHASDVHHLVSREAGRGWQRNVDDRVRDLAG